MSGNSGRHTFEQVVLFLLQRAPGEQLGITKLWKLVYYVDLMHLEQFERTVTDVRFIKGRHGPIPERGLAMLEELAGKQAIEITRIPRFRHAQHLCRALATPDLRELDFSERAILEEIALDWMRATTRQIELAVRESTPWKTAKYGDAIVLKPRPLAA